MRPFIALKERYLLFAVSILFVAAPSVALMPAGSAAAQQSSCDRADTAPPDVRGEQVVSAVRNLWAWLSANDRSEDVALDSNLNAEPLPLYEEGDLDAVLDQGLLPQGLAHDLVFVLGQCTTDPGDDVNAPTITLRLGVQVPDLGTMTQMDATTVLEQRGLAPETAPLGAEATRTVVSQSRRPGPSPTSARRFSFSSRPQGPNPSPIPRPGARSRSPLPWAATLMSDEATRSASPI